ncbi:beta-ketoacyl synthase N-terminal-like domain-containing protein [Chitinophagaceae bacterium MMS25-I14]
MNNNTAIWVCSPGYLRGVGLLANAALVNSTGVLDLHSVSPEKWGHLSYNLSSFKKYCPESAALGFRVSQKYFQALTALTEFPSDRNVFFVITDISELSELQFVRQFPQYAFYIECYAPARLRAIEEYCRREEINIAGYVIVASEAGGQAGENAAFITLQEACTLTGRPVILKGGVGVHTAAVLPLTNAAGIMLDDTVLLFPGSPLERTQKEIIARLEGRESEIFQDAQGQRFRVVQQMWAAAAQKWTAAYKMTDSADEEAVADLFTELRGLFYFGDAATSIWPVGQMVCLAEEYRKTYQTLQRFITAIRNAIQTGIAMAGEHNILSANSKLAADHHTEFPIVQGPMTRVSDTPEFALEVAKAGGLPFVALALLKSDALSGVLSQTAELLKDLPWGVGILGFVPPELREEQIQEVLRVRPQFAIIAGGRPDHATILEDAGIKTYLHVPVPSLLRSFIKQGATRFIFEGRECGGHVGPYHSFPLWEQMINILLQEIPANEGEKYSILFAGGIHDALSAAMVAALSAQLPAHGIKTGLLMGTAYLGCSEAVKTGAITPAFQDVILRSKETTLLVSGPGHANCCVTSPFTDEFKRRRRELLLQGLSPEKIAQSLDEMLLGRLRIASKGVVKKEDAYEKVSKKAIEKDGMFMAGEAAKFLSSRKSVRQLHTETTIGASALLQALAVQHKHSEEDVKKPVDIAIVGMSLFVPGATNTDDFWDIILKKKSQVKEIPKERWDWRLIFSPDPKAPDKIYSKWGGFIDDVIFDPLKYGIPPKSVPNITTAQLLALENVTLALEDAKINLNDIDKENTSVIFATTDAGGYLSNSLIVRNTLPFYAEESDDVKSKIQGWTEETFPGMLSNVVAGRIANRFDFGGRNYAVDAACASSLVAVDMSVRELTSGKSNIVIAGGIDIGQTPSGYMAFSKTGALSPTGQSLAFDKKANGIVMSEGSVVLVLKRLEDAEKNGDKIYAVIKGVAGSSDGKGMGLTAPRSEGQQLSVSRAYDEAGFKPGTIGYYEAHGTGTMVGDKEELDTIYNVLTKADAAPGSVALGSVKSLVGHTKMAAGMVSLAKTALSLYYKVLPPQGNIDQPLEKATGGSAPTFFLEEAAPWLTVPDNPRRAGVSAFGFGGTNFHAVLEEYTGYGSAEKTGGDVWPEELFVFGAATPELLTAELQALSGQLAAPLSVSLKDLAWSMVRKYTVKNHTCRLSFAAGNQGDVKKLLDKAIYYLQNSKSAAVPAKISYKEYDGQAPEVAFLFSGQGSQHINMAREMSLYFPEFRNNLELANKIFNTAYPKRFSEYLYPAHAFDKAAGKLQETLLNDTHVAQPAIGTVSTAYLDVLTRLNVQARFLAGHSFGELTALHAAGAYSRSDFFRLAEFRGRMMAASGDGEGAMAAVMAAPSQVQQIIGNHQLDVVIANYNGPEQTVISGSASAFRKANEAFAAAGIKYINLPVSAAFHSPMMAKANVALHEFISQLSIEELTVPVFSNITGKAFPAGTAAVRDLLQGHLMQPVQFMAQIKEMYREGARIFVEIGPGSVLANLVGKILDQEPHIALAAQGAGEGVGGFLSLAGRLWVEHVGINLPELFRDREVTNIDTDILEEKYSIPQPRSTSWYINGHNSRPVNPAFESMMPQPLRTLENQNKQEVNMDSEVVSNKQELSQSNHIEQAAETYTAPAFHDTDAVMAAYLAHQETMRQFLRTQERVMAMFLGGDVSMPAPEARPVSVPVYAPPVQYTARVQQPVNGTVNHIPAATRQEAPVQAVAHTAPPAPKAVEIPAAKTTATPDSEDAIFNILVKIISDSTGYPDDMITIDLDLEADLGVDSIKRMELLNRFIAFLPKGKEHAFLEQADRMVRIKKFRSLIEAFAAELGIGKNVPAAV